MTEIQLAHLSFRDDVHHQRDRFHETALHEARVATEFRQFAPEPSTQTSFVTRLRLAFAGGPSVSTDACNCPA